MSQVNHVNHVEGLAPAAIEKTARALYDQCQTVKPHWDQLGDVTKSVWRERVVREAQAVTAAPAAPDAAGSETASSGVAVEVPEPAPVQEPETVSSAHAMRQAGLF